jgi:TolA-binding protein
MRALVLAAAVAALAAPLQCERRPDPDLRQEETPGEALYGLAERFGAEGDTAARRATLEYLVERYPNSRFAVRAREELGSGHGEGGATDGGGTQ